MTKLALNAETVYSPKALGRVLDMDRRTVLAAFPFVRVGERLMRITGRAVLETLEKRHAKTHAGHDRVRRQRRR